MEKNNKINWPKVISFRINENDKLLLDQLVFKSGGNKSQFLRKKLKTILLNKK
jgi:hypothetical protein